MSSAGLVLDFLGAIALLFYSERTEGAITRADKNHVRSPWWYRIGYGLLALGFLLQVVGASLK